MADALVLGFALKIEGGESQSSRGNTDFSYHKDCIKRQIQNRKRIKSYENRSNLQ